MLYDGTTLSFTAGCVRAVSIRTQYYYSEKEPFLLRLFVISYTNGSLC